MTIVIQITLWLLLAPFIASSAYVGALSALALLPRRLSVGNALLRRRFAVVIPAHNEEAALPALLTSLRAVSYPRELVTTLVVADNCDDATAQVGRAGGALVCERRDEGHRGKGYALAHGLAQLDGQAYDAVVFIDADCAVSANLFEAFERRLDAGADAIQAYYTMTTGAESSTRGVRALALSLVHLVRPLGKSRFGGSAGLKGSGMCFSRGAIEQLGWTEFGLAEDIEQHLRVVRAGMRVEFAAEALVLGNAPASLRGAGSQHRRWEAGRIDAARRHALPLLAQGLRRRSPAMLDTAVEMLVPPLSALALVLVVFVPVSFFAVGTAMLAVDLLAIASLALYVGSGFVVARTPLREVAASLAAVPRYGLWKVVLYARAIVSRPGTWEATTRDGQETPSSTS